MNRYRITVLVEELIDVAGNTNPESGKIEEHEWVTEGRTVTITPTYAQVAKFAGEQDAETFKDAIPGMLVNLGQQFERIRAMADLADRQ